METKDSCTTFQTNLLNIRHSFESAIDSLRLDTDSIIFIDGIDVRPAEINYDDYFECVRGLIEAVWSLNNDFYRISKTQRVALGLYCSYGWTYSCVLVHTM